MISWEYKLSNQPDTPRLQAQEVSEDLLLSKIDFFMDTGVWPSIGHMDPRGWLQNFEDQERRFAINLLNAFLYYNEPLLDALFRTVVLQLGTEHITSAGPAIQASQHWHAFVDKVLVSYVEGEIPNPTDSGYVFARKARQIIGIREEQIVSPRDALGIHIENPERPILLVDDFVGSGNQMRNTWNREYELASGIYNSFKSVSDRGAQIFYIPVISTEFGLNELKNDCTGLHVRTTHVLDSRYSLTASDSILWPKNLQTGAVEFLRKVSERAGILEGSDVPWDGFHQLALSVSFFHSVPDATIPLYYWEKPGWTPLLRRR